MFVQKIIDLGLDVQHWIEYGVYHYSRKSGGYLMRPNPLERLFWLAAAVVVFFVAGYLVAEEQVRTGLQLAVPSYRILPQAGVSVVRRQIPLGRKSGRTTSNYVHRQYGGGTRVSRRAWR